MNLGNSIKTLRKSKGIKQIELATNCKLTQAYLSQIEANKKIPSGSTLKKIAENLEIPVAFILFKSLSKDDIKKEKQSAFKATQPIIEALLEQMF